MATCSVLAALIVFGYLVAESRMLSYLSSEPEVCINCHTMNTNYSTWRHSSHRAEATCVDCHLKQEWFAEGEEEGIYDPRSREGMELKTSYIE